MIAFINKSHYLEGEKTGVKPWLLLVKTQWSTHYSQDVGYLFVFVVWTMFTICVCSDMSVEWPCLLLMFCEIGCNGRTPRPSRLGPAGTPMLGQLLPFSVGTVHCRWCHQILVDVCGKRRAALSLIPRLCSALPRIILSLCPVLTSVR